MQVWVRLVSLCNNSPSLLYIYILSFYAANLLIRDTGTEVVGEQGDYYDPLFTYKEGDEASYFVISDESEVGTADVGPSSAGEGKKYPMASSSRNSSRSLQQVKKNRTFLQLLRPLGPINFSLVLFLSLSGFLLWSRLK